MFSITGEYDHAPFGGNGIQLVWGQRFDGELIHISSAERGRKCGCVCPACELALIAKRGPKLAEHFAHQGGKACAGVRETNAHAWAKKILERRKEIWIPPGIATAGKARKQAFPGQLFRFDAAKLERRNGSIVPDVVLTANSRNLIVEIRVTHPCDDVKVAKIREQGTSALEIDLRGFKTADSEDVIAHALIGTDEMRRAPREWLFNSKVDRANERLAAEMAKNEAERKARLARIASRRKAALESEAQSVIRAAKSLRVVSTDSTLADLNFITAYNLQAQVGLPVEGRGFRVPAILWQSAILSRVVIDRLDWMGGIAPAITPQLAVQEIYRDCLAHNIPSIPSVELKAAVLAADPTFVFSGEAIGLYLAHLETVGILAKEYAHTARYSAFVGWSLSASARSQFRGRSTELAEQNRRNERARTLLRLIVGKVPADERREFSLEQWLDRKISGFDVRLADLADAGGEPWRKFERALADVSRMFSDGPPVHQRMGLPIEGEIARATERDRIKQEEAARLEREAEERAASERLQSLRHRAKEVLGSERAKAWLATIAPSTNLSFLELAESSCSGFHQAHQALGAAGREMIERDRRERQAEKCRADLRSKAIEAFGSERAEVFLLSMHPRLGTSPWEYCTDPASLKVCLAQLPKSSVRYIRSHLRKLR